MQELPTPPKTLIPKPIQVKTPVSQFMQTLASTFTDKLKRIITPQRFFSPSKYKMTSGKMMVRRFQLETTTLGGSDGPDTTLDPAPSGSGAISEGGAGGLETPTPTAQMTRPLTRSATKQAPEGSTPAFMKKPSLTLVKGSSSKRPKK